MAEAALVDGQMAQPVVRVSGLEKRYGRLEAVRGVDLEVQAGEIYGLIGPDGAGKSSLMKAVAGVLTYDKGIVEVLGVPVVSERSAERVKDRIGFMPQGLGQNLYPELSVEENINFFAHSRLVPEALLSERKKDFLRITRLGSFRDRPMKHLSGGMKQKLGLICTLIHAPRLLVLDEPTTGVDPVSRRDFWAILSTLLREEHITALISTAYLDEASRFQRLSLFFGGQVIAEGETQAILDSMPGALVQIECSDQMTALERLRGRFGQVEPRGRWTRVLVEDADEELAVIRVRSALEPLEVRQVFAGRPDLEDVFFARLRKEGVEGAGKAGDIPVRGSPASSRQTRTGEADGGLEGPAIEACELVRTFGSFHAVQGVSFQVSRGEIFGLLGANGAGKTTVIKMLVGLLAPTSGTGYVAGARIGHGGKGIKEHIGYMSQVFSLYGDLTVIENIELYAGIYGLSRLSTKERAGWILEMADLRGVERQRTSTLPVGLRQRLALGCALVHRPRVLFLDEPTSGVDPVGCRRFWDLLFRLSREEGVSILITTHAMSEADRCDHLALMYAGRIVADASPEGMKRDLEAEVGGLLEIRTDRPLPALEALQREGFEGVALHGRQIHLLAPNREEIVERIRQVLAGTGVCLLGVSAQPLTMEDVFVTRVLSLEKESEGAG